MIILGIVLYFIIGYFIACLIERILGMLESPNFFLSLIIWPIGITGIIILCLLGLFEKVVIKADKLRKFIRGWD